MADLKTSAETAAGTLDGSELLRIVQGGVSKRTTLAAAAALAAASGAAYNTAAAFDAFGDSITAGTGASITANRYTNLISSRRSWTLTNHGVSGDMVADQAVLAHALVVGNGQQSTLMIGTNDARTYGSSVPKQEAFRLGHMAMLAWLSIPDTRKVYGQAGAFTGTWTNGSVYASGLIKQSSTAASTATYTVYGTVAYLCMLAQNSNGSTYSVTIDGVAKGTFNTDPGASITSVNSATYIPALRRFPGLAEGPHTIVVTIVSAPAAAYVMWAAGNQGAATKAGPNVWVGNVPRYTSAAYSTYGISDAVITAFNTAVRDNVRTLAADGLNVGLADSAARIDPPTNLGGDGLHPNDSGHDLIAEAFLEVINQAQKPRTVEPALVPPQLVEAITGTSYTILATDFGKLKTFANASAIAATLPQAGPTFSDGWWCEVRCVGAGTLTVTPGTSTINGASSLILTVGQTARIVSDGVNYFAQLGASPAVASRGVLALTDAATITVNATNNDNFRVTLGGNRTLGNPTGLADGQVLNFRIIQDGTGSRTLAYASKYKFAAGTAPVLSTAAASKDFMSCQYDATDDTLYCSTLKAFA